MEMLLSYLDGRRIDAMLLAGGDGMMRVALRDQSDAVELRLVAGQWYDEEGCALEIEAITTDGDCDIARICSQALQRTLRAVG